MLFSSVKSGQWNAFSESSKAHVIVKTMRCREELDIAKAKQHPSSNVPLPVMPRGHEAPGTLFPLHDDAPLPESAIDRSLGRRISGRNTTSSRLFWLNFPPGTGRDPDKCIVASGFDPAEVSQSKSSCVLEVTWCSNNTREG